MTITVCVASSFPESGNRNAGIVTDLADAMRRVLGPEAVHVLPFRDLPRRVRAVAPSLLVLVGSALPVACDYRAVAEATRRAGTCFAFWTVEDPYEMDARDKFAAWADIVLTNELAALPWYDRADVHHLPLAASAALARPLDGYAERPLDVFFCGVGFPNRRRFVADALPVLARHRSLVLGDNWSADAGGIVENRRLDHPALLAHYASSRVVLNLGRSFSYANRRHAVTAITPGPRTFEAAMVGTVQICMQPSLTLDRYFARGEEIVGVDGVDAFAERLEALLAGPDEALAIARRAQARALAEHSYDHRAAEILRLAGLALRPGCTEGHRAARPPGLDAAAALGERDRERRRPVRMSRLARLEA